MPTFHIVAHALHWLYTRDYEAAHLWHALRLAFPEALGCCLMPDHLHLLLPHCDAQGRFRQIRGGYSRWLTGQPRWVQPFRWGRVAPPEELAADPGHAQRTIRYLGLNPCRGGLVADPLAWLWSTHRDAVGFAVDPWVRSQDPARRHAYVSGDPSVSIVGTPMPSVKGGVYDLRAVSRAVAAVMRVGAPEVTHGRGRSLALRTAMAFGHDDLQELSDWAECTTRQVRRALAEPIRRWDVIADDTLQACVRAVGDDRFDAPWLGELPRTAAWQAYRRAREAKRAATGLLRG